MIHTINTPLGVDVPIQQLQSDMFTQLRNVWGLSEDDWESYGRVYRNQNQDGYVPEAYKIDGNYTEVFLNDTVAVSSFFGLGEQTTYDIGFRVPVHLVFNVNLSALKKEMFHRADEEVRRDVKLYLADYSFGFTLTTIETGIDNVFREYPGSRRNDSLRARDMHPYHMFRANMTLFYRDNH